MSWSSPTVKAVSHGGCEVKYCTRMPVLSLGISRGQWWNTECDWWGPSPDLTLAVWSLGIMVVTRNTSKSSIQGIWGPWDGLSSTQLWLTAALRTTRKKRRFSAGSYGWFSFTSRSRREIADPVVSRLCCGANTITGRPTHGVRDSLVKQCFALFIPGHLVLAKNRKRLFYLRFLTFGPFVPFAKVFFFQLQK